MTNNGDKLRQRQHKPAVPMILDFQLSIKLTSKQNIYTKNMITCARLVLT